MTGGGAPQQRAALEHATRVLVIQSEQHTRSLADASEHELNAPDLTLVLEAELADELHLVIETLLLERTARRTRRLPMVAQEGGVRHRSVQGSTTRHGKATCTYGKMRKILPAP